MNYLFNDNIQTVQACEFPSIITPNTLELRDAYSQWNFIKQLEDNWDGYGAVTPSVSTSWNVLALIHKLQAYLKSSPFLFPNPHGTISIEVEGRNNVIIEFEVGIDEGHFYIKGEEVMKWGYMNTNAEEDLPSTVKKFL
ncbi:MAG: hypothetical protein WD077_14865 [Bacteroidia bacterium]